MRTHTYTRKHTHTPISPQSHTQTGIAIVVNYQYSLPLGHSSSPPSLALTCEMLPNSKINVDQHVCHLALQNTLIV